MSSRLRRLGIEKVNTLVDIGAHHGGFIDEVKLDYSPSKIWAIEPNPQYLQVLHDKGAIVHNCAVGKVNSRRPFYRYKEDQASSLLPLLPEVSQRYGFDNPLVDSFDINVYTLDYLIPDIAPIDLIKIDVQGSELDVISGGTYMVLHNATNVIIECNCIPQYQGGSTITRVIIAMIGLGFKLQHLFAPNCGTDNALPNYDDRIMLHCDAHFVKAQQ